MNPFAVLATADAPTIPPGAHVMTATVTLPPGDPGTPPHRHSGPVFGYLLEGEMLFELQGERPRVITEGEAFWEPGGEVIHFQAANNLPDRRTVFLVVMICAPDQEMLVLLSPEELKSLGRS